MKNWLRPSSPVMTYVGIAVSIVGFVLIVIAWAAVAGKAEVYLQVPYVVSAGFSGLGLIIAGVTIVNVATRRRDEAERSRQMDRLAQLLQERPARKR